MIHTYFQHVTEGFALIEQKEFERIKAASEQVARVVRGNGIIHIFGCGHSHMMAEEAFYRAGGLVPVNPILVEPLMLHEGAVRSSKLERTHAYGAEIAKNETISSDDMVFVVSTSGRNPVPIDFALTAKEKGCFVAALTSRQYAEIASRHPGGRHLSECADLVIDNHVDPGDAVLHHEKVRVPFMPVSTIYNAAILNAVFGQAVVQIADDGGSPPIFLSGNVDGSDAHNEKLIARYEDRIPLFKKNEEV